MVQGTLFAAIETDVDTPTPTAHYNSARRMWTFPEGETRVDRALRTTAMDWEVEKRPLSYRDNRGEELAANCMAVVRRDNSQQLGIATDRYRCVQNVEASRLFEPLLEGGKWRIDALGVSKNGRVWISAESSDEYDITGKGDQVRSRLIGHWKHDGAAAVAFQHLPRRVVCSNMVQRLADDAAGQGLCVRHFGDTGRALNIAREIFNQLERRTVEDVALMLQLARKPLRGNVNDFFWNLVEEPRREDYKTDASHQVAINRRDRILADMRQRYDAGMGLDLCDRGNYWAVLNAVTESVDHYLASLTAKRDYIDYAVFGDGARLRGLAFEQALAA